MPGRVEIRTRPQQHQVGLRLRVRIETDWILDLDDRASSDPAVEKAVQAGDTGGMAASNRTYLDDFPPNQLDAIVFRQNAGAAHLVVFFNRESACADGQGELDYTKLFRAAVP
jgi:hypothetical protein